MNVADDHPEVVARLRRALDAWRADVAALSLAEGDQAVADPEELEQLRALGYVE